MKINEVFVVTISMLQFCIGDDVNHTHVTRNYTFPKDFIFGVSTSALQIEGGWNEGGKGESIWDKYLHQHPDYTPDGLNADVACDSYHMYMDDIAIIRKLNVSHYRLSISWPRLLPNATDNYVNEDGVKYYRRLFEELLKVNITPVVTMFHWDMPTILMDLGGWSNPKIVHYFEDYARVVFTLYGDIIKIWITINELHQQCSESYGSDALVPALLSHGVGEYLCTHYILLSHARVYRMYEKEFRPSQKGQVGLTLDVIWAEPKDTDDSEDREAAERFLQMHFGMYAHPIFSETGDYPESVRNRIDKMSDEQGFSRSRLPTFTQVEILALRGSSDFFGLNHYTTQLMSPSTMEKEWYIPSLSHDTGVKGEYNPDWPKPGASWLAVYPPGLRKHLNWIMKNFRILETIPIYITENGMSDHGGLKDYSRVSYFNEYLHQVLLAMHEDGCNVKGYFAWTLMDDFEWNSGYTDKFGLYHVDFSSPEKRRIPKLSAKNYAHIVTTGKIDFNYINHTMNLSNQFK